ncbi:MAG: radical SAM protein [Planctomycetota bacterium]
MIAYGPVPSRRLGRSLGVNNIPPKICTYSCVYCQVGRTMQMETEPRTFYEPRELTGEVCEKVKATQQAGEHIDYVSFVPDGEPTLDANLGEEIQAMEALGQPAAVISNASLMWREDVRERLMKADWVSVKVDAVTPKLWRQINRPHRDLDINAILEGIHRFAGEFAGKLNTETMLVHEINDSEENAEGVADFLREVQPDTAYVSIPTRPPAEKWAHRPSETAVNRFYQIVDSRVENVEYLIGYEGNAFAASGNVEEDLLSITAVHPMREEAVQKLLDRNECNWSGVEKLRKQGKIKVTEHENKRYFMRTLPRDHQ